MMIRFWISCCLLLGTWQLAAQAPTAACARILVGVGQDSIVWEYPTPCPNFDAFLVYRSPNAAGPFTPVDTISSPSTLFSVQGNPNESPLFYYITAVCGGQASTPTTIVSNQQPITPNIRSVDVVNGFLELSWNNSPTSNVIGYQVYKEAPYGSGNFFPYPGPNQTITSTSFVDSMSTDLLARYAIVAITPCNAGLVGLGTAADGTTGPHTSMILESSLDRCARSIDLNWNAYENWEQGVEHYQIWLSTNGAPALPIDTVFSNSYVFENAVDGDSLRFFIRAKELGQNNTAQSSSIRIDVDVNDPMEQLQIRNVDVAPDNQSLQVDWAWDTQVDHQSASLQIQNENGDWTTLQNLNAPSLPNEGYTHGSDAATRGPVFYRLQHLDACDIEELSNIGASLYLEGLAENGINRLQWPAWAMPNVEVERYELFRVDGNGNSSLLALLSDSLRRYRDDLDVRDASQASLSYYLIAYGELQLPDGSRVAIEGRSNTVDLQQSAVIYAPNAFAPEGKNDEFRPLVVFGTAISQYQMQIYDRWGGLLFETTDLDQGWDGTKNGRHMPLGSYVYHIRLQQPDGQWIEKQGVLMLLR